MIERGQKIKIIAGIMMLSFVAVSILSSHNENILLANLSQNMHKSPLSVTCEKLTLASQPNAPLPAYTSALIRVQVEPATFTGSLTFSADSGVFDDLTGHRNAYIETNEKIVTFSGGEPGAVLTIEDKEGNNPNCYATIEVSSSPPTPCFSLVAQTSPSPLTENQSVEIEIISHPNDFNGTYLIQADSGKLQPSTADVKTSGVNTNTLITSSKFLLYNGGKKGEKIHIQALGENNTSCQTTLAIEES